MDLAYGQDQESLRRAMDELGRQLAAVPGDADPDGTPEAAAELAALPVPIAFGGRGLGLLDLVIALEALGTGGVGRTLRRRVALHAAAAWAITEGGTPEQHRVLLPQMAAGMLNGQLIVQDDEPGFHLKVGDEPLPVSDLAGFAPAAGQAAGRLRECIDLLLAAGAVGEYRHVFDAVTLRVRRFSQRRKLAGQPVESEQALYHRLADLKVQLDVAQLLVHRGAWSVERSTGSADGAVALLALRELRAAALALTDELAARRLPVDGGLAALRSRIATLDADIRIAPEPRRRVAAAVWSVAG